MTDFRRKLLAIAALSLSAGFAHAQYLISTFAGGLQAPTAAQATGYAFGTPTGLATDHFGNTYISTSTNLVFRLDASGNVSRMAGDGHAGFSGDGNLAVYARLNNPQGLAVDVLGNLYIADQGNQRIRQVTPTGIITTVAGTGTAGYSSDNVPATSAELSRPAGLATDNLGNVYVADMGNNLVRKFAPGGVITSVAGTRVRGTGGDGGPATSATLTSPNSLAVDPLGDIFISDASSQVRVVGPNGVMNHFAGTGSQGYSGDGGSAAVAQMGSQLALAMDSAGNLYISDQLFGVVRIVNPAGIINTYAGGGSSTSNGVTATGAILPNPSGVAVDFQGNLYIAESDYKVRAVNSSSLINTVAGTGSVPFSGDGGPAGLAQFSNPWGIARDGSGNFYVADSRNYRVRKIAAGTGIVSTIAGTGVEADSGNGGPATSAAIQPHVVAAFGGYVYEAGSAQVRQITPGGAIVMVAGTGAAGVGADNVPATSSALSSYITGLAFDPSGNMYIADTLNNKVRVVSPGGTITTVAGTGTAGFSGDGNVGASAQLSGPAGLAVDAAGNYLYIADSGNCRIRKLSLAPNGTISTVAGNGTCSDSGDGTSATAASISSPEGVAVDANGVIYLATQGNTIRTVSAQGVINTIAGSASAGYSGDGGPATTALLNSPLGLVVDGSGNLYVSDSNDNALRVLQPTNTAPLLTVSSTHSGSFTAGSNAQFQVTVNDASGAGAISGTVTVTDTLPSSLAPVSMGGSGGWGCTYSSPSYTCQNSSPLSGGAGYLPLNLSVSVASGAPIQVTNQVTVSGGGDIGSSSEDLAFVGAASPMLEISATHFGNFVAGGSGSFSIFVSNAPYAPSTGSAVSVADTVPAGLTLVSLNSANGWNCTGASCTNSAALAGGASYYPISGTVTVASNASSPLTNQATVSGGGSPSATAYDSIVIVPQSCAVTGGSSVTVSDVQAEINEALGGSRPQNDLNQDGVVNVTDIQIVVNAVLTSNCVV